MFIIQGFCGDENWIVCVAAEQNEADQYLSKLETAALQATEWIEGDAPSAPSDFTNLFKDIDPNAAQYAADLGDMLEWEIKEVPAVSWTLSTYETPGDLVLVDGCPWFD